MWTEPKPGEKAWGRTLWRSESGDGLTALSSYEGTDEVVVELYSEGRWFHAAVPKQALLDLVAKSKGTT